MKDRAGQAIFVGATVTFYPARGQERKAVVTDLYVPTGNIRHPRAADKVLIKIAGDPFPVGVTCSQIEVFDQGKEAMTATVTAPNRRELRKQAAALHIPDWEGMSGAELAKAVNAAPTNGHRPRAAKVGAVTKKPRGTTRFDEPKATTRPARNAGKKGTTGTPTKAPRKAVPGTPRRSTGGPGKKAAPVKSPGVAPKPAQSPARGQASADSPNPFRKNTNLWLMTEEILKGGSRMSMIGRLVRKIDLHPWAKRKPDLDLTYEMDKRILLTANLLSRQHGWTIELGGRGPANGTIKGTPPAPKKPGSRKAA